MHGVCVPRKLVLAPSVTIHLSGRASVQTVLGDYYLGGGLSRLPDCHRCSSDLRVPAAALLGGAVYAMANGQLQQPPAGFLNFEGCRH